MEITDTIQENKRIGFIDLAKGICILQIVILHFVNGVLIDNSFFDYCRYLRMPLYFCLSGLFYKNYGSRTAFWKKKTNNILIPFIAWYLISYSILFVRGFLLSTPSKADNEILDLFYGRPLFNNPIWFLLALFWCNVIFNFILTNVRNVKYQIAGVVILTIIGNIMAICELPNPLYMATALSCMPFFCMGYLLKKTSLLYATSNKKMDFLFLMGGVLILGVMILLPWQIPHFAYHLNEYYSNGNPVLFYLFSGVFVVSVILLCKFFKHIPYISYIGRYSIIVLVTHILIFYVIDGILNKFFGFTDPNNLRLTGEICLLLLSLLVVIPFCKRYLPYICAQKELFKVNRKKEFLIPG